MRKAIAILGMLTFAACSDSTTEPETFPFPAVSGSYQVTAVFANPICVGTGDQITGTLTIAQPSRSVGQLNASATNMTSRLCGSPSQMVVQSAEGSVTEQGQLTFKLTSGTSVNLTGTLGSGGMSMSGTWSMVVASTTYTGTWSAQKLP